MSVFEQIGLYGLVGQSGVSDPISPTGSYRLLGRYSHSDMIRLVLLFLSADDSGLLKRLELIQLNGQTSLVKLNHANLGYTQKTD